MDEENEKSAQNSDDTDYETDEEALGNHFQHFRNHSKLCESNLKILILILISTSDEKFPNSARDDSRHPPGGSDQHQVQRILIH